MILGDFNASISAMEYASHLSHENINSIENLKFSENGELHLDMIREQKLYNLNTAFEHKTTRRYTRHTPDPAKKNQIIDFINVNRNLKRLCQNCRVKNSIITRKYPRQKYLIEIF